MDLGSVTRCLEGWDYFTPSFIHSSAQQPLTEKVLPHATHSSENRANNGHVCVGAGSDFHAFFRSTPHPKVSCVCNQLANGLGFHAQLPGSGQEQEVLALSCCGVASGWAVGRPQGRGLCQKLQGSACWRL